MFLSRLSDRFRVVFHIPNSIATNDKFDVVFHLVCLCFSVSLLIDSFASSVSRSHIFNSILVRLAESWFFLLMISFHYAVKIKVGLLLFVGIVELCACENAWACSLLCVPCWFSSIRSFSRSFVSLHLFMFSFIVTLNCLHTQTLLKWIALVEFYHFRSIV